ncbi:MAG: hypothetical protein ACRC7H_10210 [Plesiomonas shigelloides]
MLDQYECLIWKQFVKACLLHRKRENMFRSCKLTKYSHFTGADFRAVLLRTLEKDVTEEMLIEKCPTLSIEHDRITGSGTAGNPHDLFWETSANVEAFFKELRVFLEARLGSLQDLSFAAGTKQGAKESAALFFVRFKKAWVEDSKLPINNELKSLFVNTLLNNISAKQAQLIRITTSNLHDMTLEALGKRIRELDASGGFSIKSENTMFSGFRGKRNNEHNFENHQQPHSSQKRKSEIICFHCGKKGHYKRV